MQFRVERENTDVVDVLFLVLKSYECTAHQLFRGKTDHDRIIERNKIRFLYSGSDFIYFRKPTKCQTVRRVVPWSQRLSFNIIFFYLRRDDRSAEPRKRKPLV